MMLPDAQDHVLPAEDNANRSAQYALTSNNEDRHASFVRCKVSIGLRSGGRTRGVPNLILYFEQTVAHLHMDTAEDLPFICTTLASPSDIPKTLINHLVSHLPHSLPIVGHITTPRAVTSITLYTTFQPDTQSFPEFFCVGVLSSELYDDQEVRDVLIRFYCSSEKSQRVPSAELAERRFRVGKFMQTWIPLLRRAAGQCHRLSLGCLHEDWVGEVRGLAKEVQPPIIKFLHPPTTPNYTNRVSLPIGWRIAPLQASDIARVISTSSFRRSVGYIVSRQSYSRSIWIEDRLAGWGLYHSDGSIGTLYVEEEFRGRKVGSMLIDILQHVHLRGGDSPLGVCGWWYVDTTAGGSDGEQMFSHLRGWEFGWKCFWISL